MDRIFRIGDFCFRLICGEGIVPPEHFMVFAAESREPEYTYSLEYGRNFPACSGAAETSQPDLVVFQEGGLETRYIGVKGAAGYFACYQEESDRSARVIIDPDVRWLDVDPVFVSLLALERRMNDWDGLILHCAYLAHQGSAILFSAPSGTGKSTQAGLWEQYRGGKTVNGDRCLLQKIDGQWHARGWPVCGSSGICENRDLPVRAIVMLSQGKTDTAQKFSPFRAFSQLYPQVTVNYWNREAQNKAMGLLEEIVSRVPVIHLSCTISEHAVACLEEKLRD